MVGQGLALPTAAQDTQARAREFNGSDSLGGEIASFQHAKELYNYFTPKIEKF